MRASSRRGENSRCHRSISPWKTRLCKILGSKTHYKLVDSISGHGYSFRILSRAMRVVRGGYGIDDGGKR